ncbi:MAG: 50S ribosomal protein L24 [Candidatus Kaiserbacteria bacterium GW2011_GWA2_49_19]|uniref:Large ribosomal subunit protein uL24 n=2 Tax=Candidatus Kaiseribacteriota TaxID=1752734 RepID=A0A0G1Y192_9BACT|nr:MAG: 50S ribosomal protein L24 [Candidatus Kaiserbacteria bacterium GW2011_GWA2_49_19]OGG60928.1 MAG: 50S ribosomal protein L24 [Candidatus Kaiserbacteria bacterium RIFCSPHIGHO2_02_FULL_49_16]
MKLKKGDKVIVIAGKNRGATGTISLALPKKERVLIDGINLVKKHRRPSAKNRKGQIVDKPMSIHISNVMLSDPKGGKATRIRIVRKGGVRSRVAVKSGQEVK